MAQKLFRVSMKFYDKKWNLVFVLYLGEYSISSAENTRACMQHNNPQYIVVANYEEILPKIQGDFLGYDNLPF